MPNPAVTLKLKRFRQRFGVAAPKVTVRTHFGWPWYAGAVGALVVLVGVLVWSFAQRGEAVALQAELSQLRQQRDEMGEELTRLRAQAGTEQSAVRMEKATQQQLMARLKSLEQENAALKEDISLFERLVPVDGAAAAVRIESLAITPAPEAGRFRYRLLVRYQATRQEKEFKGRLQLVVLAAQAGKDIRLELPAAGREGAESLIEVRHFLRKEGSFSLPPGAKLRSVEARLLQGGAVKATQLVNF